MASKPPASKEVAKTTGGAVSNEAPDYLKDERGSGLKGLDASDFVVPRVKLLQGTSPELTANENAKQRNFWVTVVDVPLGPEFEFMPLSNKKHYLLIPPLVKGNDKVVFARAEDAKTWVPGEGEWEVYLKGQKNPVTWKITDPDVRKSGLANYGTSDPDNPDSKPAATLFYDFLVIIKGHEELGPVLLSLARTQAKRGKDLQGKIELRNKPMQSQVFKAVPTDENSDEGPYFNVQFQMSGWATFEEYQRNLAIAERFKEYRAADEAEAADEGPSSAGPKDRGDV